MSVSPRRIGFLRRENQRQTDDNLEQVSGAGERFAAREQQIGSGAEARDAARELAKLN